MKRLVLSILTLLLLTATFSLVAQTTGSTGSSSVTGRPETEQGEGMDMDVDVGNRAEDGLVDVDVSRTSDADTSAQGNDTNRATTGNTNLRNETETGTGVDVDVDTGDRAAGAVDVDVKRTTDADTDASGVDETGGLDNDANTAGDSAALPETASNELLVALIGLFALGAAFSIRFANRNA
ncbi:MAG TPA: hypothetical protein VMW27_01370 [Thermoanaerobaculia bacterium]|nr:hypothetical protein [Thermoanaerobaculia bacterium]